MSASKRITGFAKSARRQHRLNREQVDAMPWPHPRPASDPRLVWLHVALMYTALAQSIAGPPENTITGQSFGWAATVAFGALLTICVGLYLTAAYCKSQYESFGYETAACVGFAGSLSIYAVMLTLGTPNWSLTYNWSFCVGLAFGNAIRAFVIIKRFW